MNAIFLCAGFATRMYPLTRNFPKPLLEVAGRPVLDYLLDQVVELDGLETIHVVTNARFVEHFETWQAGHQARLAEKSLSLQLYNDGSTENDNRLGAVGDLGVVIASQASWGPTLVVAGDNIFRFDLKPHWNHFLRSGQHHVVALEELSQEKLRRTGVLELDSDDRVLAFHEKPDVPPSSWACPPIYFLGESALQRVPEYLAQPDAGDAPGDFVRFLSDHEPVHAFRVRGERLDIGSQASFAAADELLRREPVIVG